MSLVRCESHFNQSGVSRLIPSMGAVQKVGYGWTVPDKTSLLRSIDLPLSFWKLSEEEAFGVRLTGLKANKVMAEVEEVVATRDG